MKMTGKDPYSTGVCQGRQQSKPASQRLTARVVHGGVIVPFGRNTGPLHADEQNRQEDRDRIRAENDYQVNLKSARVVRIISEKLDQLLHQEMRRFMEIRQVQVEMLNEMHSKLL